MSVSVRCRRDDVALELFHVFLRQFDLQAYADKVLNGGLPDLLLVYLALKHTLVVAVYFVLALLPGFNQIPDDGSLRSRPSHKHGPVFSDVVPLLFCRVPFLRPALPRQSQAENDSQSDEPHYSHIYLFAFFAFLLPFGLPGFGGVNFSIASTGICQTVMLPATS